MATPTTAGLSALVRQYFTDGWYPSGTKTPIDGFNPSAAMTKATILTSGQHLDGTVDVTAAGLYVPIPKPPSFYQGYGRIQLDKVLRLDGADPMELYVGPKVDRVLQLDESHSVCVTVRAKGEFKATVVWSDPPGNPASVYQALVNDIDLHAVEASTGKVIYGNNGLYGPKSEGYPDTINNAEQVSFKNTGHTQTEVTLTTTLASLGKPLNYTNQAYALVAYGDMHVTDGACAASSCPKFNGTVCNGFSCNGGSCACDSDHSGSVACAPSCPNNCSSSGMCVDGKRCLCEKGAFGHDCSMGPCHGEVTLTGESGKLGSFNMPPSGDASGKQLDSVYLPDMSCKWKIKMADPDDKVELTLSAFDTEASYDGVMIYDGEDSSSPAIAFKSGKMSSDSPWSPIVSSGSSMYVEFSSDASQGSGEPMDKTKGFFANFRRTGCPGACSGHGACGADTVHKCKCEDGWFGPQCSALSECHGTNQCSGHGQCNPNNGGCDCDAGWGSVDCSAESLCGKTFTAESAVMQDHWYQGGGTSPCTIKIKPPASSFSHGSQALVLSFTTLDLGAQDSLSISDKVPASETAIFKKEGLFRFPDASDTRRILSVQSWTGEMEIALTIASTAYWAFVAGYHIMNATQGANATVDKWPSDMVAVGGEVTLSSPYFVFDELQNLHSDDAQRLKAWFCQSISEFYTEHNMPIQCQVASLEKSKTAATAINVAFSLATHKSQAFLKKGFAELEIAIQGGQVKELAHATVVTESLTCNTIAPFSDACPPNPGEAGYCAFNEPPPEPSPCPPPMEILLEGEERGAFGTMLGVVLVLIFGCGCMAFYCMTKEAEEVTDVTGILSGKPDVRSEYRGAHMELEEQA